KLEEWGLADHTVEINQKGAEIARKAAGEDNFVAGSIGPTGHLPASGDRTLGKSTFPGLVEVCTGQAEGLVNGGADLITIDSAEGRDAKPRPKAGPPLISSMMGAVELAQTPAPTIVGERVNSQGSRKAKELLLADDYDGLLQIATNQVEGGAHVLDLCVAL